MEIVERKLKLADVDALTLFGINDSNLQLIESKFEANLIVRGDTVLVRGELVWLE